MLFKEVVVLNFLLVIVQCQNGNFITPEVTLEAYKPKGFKASIPAVDGIKLFTFHGNLNKEISQSDPGQFSGDLTSPTDQNFWSYVNDDLELKVGDTIYFWVFIQRNKLGYRKDAQNWTVRELLNKEDINCQLGSSVVAKRSPFCQNAVIFEDNFSGPNIDRSKWLIEEFIPFYNSADYEFVSYQNNPSVCYIKNNNLFIKPKPAQNEEEVRGELDLRKSCTRTTEDECYAKHHGVFIIPPVTSARMVSLLNFRYGKVEIKAKLPAGDWLYPQVYLEQVSDPSKRIWIAYARGNKQLLLNNNEDIGNSLLFGGPVLHPQEPHRSTYLRTRRNNAPFSNQMHNYTVVWSKNRISLEVDGVEYGEVDENTMQDIKFSDTDMVRLVLGVGVGGVNDFPDGVRSGKDMKPWRNVESAQSKKFFLAREQWLKTWIGDNIALQVDYVKISAV